MDSYEELRQSEREHETELYYENRVFYRKREPEVKHTSQIGELIYKYYPKAPQLVFIKANQLSNKMTEKGYSWWAIKEKVQRILEYCDKRNRPPQYVIGAFNGAIRKMADNTGTIHG